MRKLLLALAFLLPTAPSFAQIAFDAVSELVCLTTCADDPTFSRTHTPVGTPKGAITLVVNQVDSTDDISACTYGGVAMAKICFANDTAGGPGSATLFFLGESIPTGAQTVLCTDDDITASNKHLATITVTAGANTETAGSDTCEVNGDAANPSCTITSIPGVSYAVAGLYSGQGAPASVTAETGETMREQADFGTDTSHIESSTTEQASGDQVVGFTSTSIDVALCAIAIQQVASAAVAPKRRMIVIQ